MIKTEIKLPLEYSSEDIKDALTAILPVGRDEIGDVRIVKRSLNVSDKRDIHYDLTVAAEFSPEREAGLLKMRKKVTAYDEMRLDFEKYRGTRRPVVVGAGPAGLFAALALAESGARPILYERGLPVAERRAKVDAFNTLGILDTECNIQFGEGGAGTYSDGKLKVGSLDRYKLFVLREFVRCGAPEDVVYSVGAHLGTDKLSNIVEKIRQKIEELGGEARFESRLKRINIRDGRVVGGVVEHCGCEEKFETDTIVLATGHSARDVFEMLADVGASLEPRGFGIGVRIEHPREYIDTLVYGKERPETLGAASYHLVTHLPNGRSVYSFCMCPGGTVVAAASEKFGIVTNGMSEYSRSAENSNAAFLVSVTPADFASGGPLAGIDLQRSIERRAYLSAGESYKAPAFTMGAFMRGDKSASLGGVSPSYPLGTETVSPVGYLPDFITESLKHSIPDFDDWMHGFYYPDAVLTGPETRTTSPIRVLRGDDCMALGIDGLYPTGEGAGYAGGIISSARDGLIVAESIVNRHK